MMKTIGQALAEVAQRHPRIVMTDGKQEWTVEQLLSQARADRNAPGRPGEEASNPSYFWGYTGDGSVSVSKFVPGGGGSFAVLLSTKPPPGRPPKLPSSGIIPVDF